MNFKFFLLLAIYIVYYSKDKFCLPNRKRQLLEYVLNFGKGWWETYFSLLVKKVVWYPSCLCHVVEFKLLEKFSLKKLKYLLRYLGVAGKIEYEDLENGSLEYFFASKNEKTGISRKNNGYLEFNLENENLDNSQT